MKDSVIFGVRGAPPQIREEAAKRGLEVVADATCPYVVEQEEAAIKLLEEGYNLVILSDPNHHGAIRIKGIAEKMERPLFIIDHEDDVDKITLMRQEPLGVIVQTTFWMETYKAIMARILERFSNVRVRNTACIDSLQRLPVIAELAQTNDAVVIVGWTEGMAFRMVETARMYCDKVLMLEHPDKIDPDWFKGLKSVGVLQANETPGLDGGCHYRESSNALVVTPHAKDHLSAGQAGDRSRERDNHSHGRDAQWHKNSS